MAIFGIFGGFGWFLILCGITGCLHVGVHIAGKYLPRWVIVLASAFMYLCGAILVLCAVYLFGYAVYLVFSGMSAMGI
jgi:hypothetical protein